jgi:hypothetical protein
MAMGRPLDHLGGPNRLEQAAHLVDSRQADQVTASPPMWVTCALAAAHAAAHLPLSERSVSGLPCVVFAPWLQRGWEIVGANR